MVFGAGADNEDSARSVYSAADAGMVSGSRARCLDAEGGGIESRACRCWSARLLLLDQLLRHTTLLERTRAHLLPQLCHRDLQSRSFRPPLGAFDLCALLLSLSPPDLLVLPACACSDLLLHYLLVLWSCVAKGGAGLSTARAYGERLYGSFQVHCP